MKKKHSMFKRLLAGGLSAILSAGLLATPVFAADDLVNTPYEYPIVPGTPEWFEMKSFPEKIEACKIPEDKAKSMSTEALTETILNHPLWPLYFCYEMDSVYDIYRDDLIAALQELETRDDADELLLERYQADQVAPMAVYDAETFETSSKSDYLEILLAQPVFYDNLNEAQLTTLDETVAQKAAIRKASDDYTENSVFYSILDAQQNGAISSRGVSATVYTPKGHPVSVRIEDKETNLDTQKYTEKMRKYFTNLVVDQDANYKYNCHSYAWYSMLPSNPYWMDDPSIYWGDGSYVKTTPAIGSVPANNLRGFFKTGSDKRTWHSVVVVGRYSGSINPYSQNLNLCKVKSKWGKGPTYIHYLLDHPWCRKTSIPGEYFPDCSNYSLTFYR